MWLFYLPGTGIVVDENSKDPFSFDDIFNSSFKPRSFDVQWIKGIGRNHGQLDDGGAYDPFQESMRLLASNTQSINPSNVFIYNNFSAGQHFTIAVGKMSVEKEGIEV